MPLFFSRYGGHPSDPSEQVVYHTQPVAGLSEEELKAIYQDLLRHDVPPSTPSPEPAFVKSIPDPAVVVPRLMRRIVKQKIPEIDSLPSLLSSKLRSRLSPAITVPHSIYHSQDKPYSELLNALQKDDLNPALPILGDGNATSCGVMTLPEWTALVEACVRFHISLLRYVLTILIQQLQEYDVDGAFTTLRVMKVCLLHCSIPAHTDCWSETRHTSAVGTARAHTSFTVTRRPLSRNTSLRQGVYNRRATQPSNATSPDSHQSVMTSHTFNTLSTLFANAASTLLHSNYFTLRNPRVTTRLW
jgi:hypothetical protein